MTFKLNQRDVILEPHIRKVDGREVTYITVHSKKTWKNPQVSLEEWI